MSGPVRGGKYIIEPGNLEDRVHFSARSYQRAALEARLRGCDRFVEAIHRRAGKDRFWLNLTSVEMLKTVGVYYHFFPSLNQGRRDLWDNIVNERKPSGEIVSLKMMHNIPREFVVATNETEMQTTLSNGSIHQIMGADSKESIEKARGSNPRGLVFSEYAHMDPYVWDVLAPVLAENGGWAAFISTPYGDNHFRKLWDYGKATGGRWYVSFYTVDDTKRDGDNEDGFSRVIAQTEIDDLRGQGKREEWIQQEFYCSWTGYSKGTIYGDLIAKAREEKHIGLFPYNPAKPVGICFDVGHDDAAAVWFYQRYGNATVFIRYEERVQTSPSEWNKLFREGTQYIFGRMILPWDGRGHEAYYSEVGFRNIQVVPRTGNLSASIETVRSQFPQFYFNEMDCLRGIECLEKYSNEWDEDNQVFGLKPLHNQYSHGADALRSGVEGGFDPLLFDQDWTKPIEVKDQFDPREI